MYTSTAVNNLARNGKQLFEVANHVNHVFVACRHVHAMQICWTSANYSFSDVNLISMSPLFLAETCGSVQNLGQTILESCYVGKLLGWCRCHLCAILGTLGLRTQRPSNFCSKTLTGTDSRFCPSKRLEQRGAAAIGSPQSDFWKPSSSHCFMDPRCYLRTKPNMFVTAGG